MLFGSTPRPSAASDASVDTSQSGNSLISSLLFPLPGAHVTPTTPRLRPDYAPTTPRLRPAYAPTSPRLRPHYAPTTPRLRPDYAPTTPRLRPGEQVAQDHLEHTPMMEICHLGHIVNPRDHAEPYHAAVSARLHVEPLPRRQSIRDPTHRKLLRAGKPQR